MKTFIQLHNWYKQPQYSIRLINHRINILWAVKNELPAHEKLMGILLLESPQVITGYKRLKRKILKIYRETKND